MSATYLQPDNVQIQRMSPSSSFEVVFRSLDIS